MKYFIGEFDGISFRPDGEKQEGHWLDYGKDFYAGVSWNNLPDDRRLMIAWADNWQYRDFLPTSPFKGQMSSIRELKLKKRGRKESAENYINLTCFNCWYIERKG